MSYPLYTRIYWLAWLLMLAAFATGAALWDWRNALGWFALFSGLGAVAAGSFEFGRFAGFTRTHFPERWSQLSRAPSFAIFSGPLHPAIVRELFVDELSLPKGYVPARNALRRATAFELTAILTLVVLANVR